MLTTLCSAWRGTFRLSLLLILILTWPTAGRAQDAMARAQQALQAMEVAAGGALTPTLSPVTGLVTFLATHAGSPLPVAVSGGTTPEEVTQAFLAAYGAAFGIDNRADMQVTTSRGMDAVGMQHVRLQQLHRGVRVTAGEMTVHLRGPAVIAVHAKTVADLTALDVIPTLPPEEAQAQVHAFIAKRFGISDAVLSEPRLEILNPGLLEDRQTSSYLAWFVQATAPALHEYCWVNAETGGLILHIRQLTDALDRQIYNGGESTILPGTLARSEGDPPRGDADTDNAYTFLGDTYNYYLTDHGRDSVDNAGLTLVATVHSCADPNQPCPLPNAFWNGTQMVFGDGFASADDITAHELTHGVTQYSANLFYYMQSGALNESFSDIFGESVDLTNGRGTDTAAVRWLIGEDLPGIGAFRNMMNPPQFGDPGKVSDTQFRCTSGDADHDSGGVHTNSGVPNHAYALMVDGGTYNGVTITGIGLAKAAKVQYRSLTHYLVSGSNFLDNYNALQQSCADLIGTAGITSADCAEVKKALDVVEMFMTPCPQPPEPALCAVGQTPTNVFFDNAENGGSNWQFGNLWSPVKGFARSGVVSFFGNDTTTPADSRLTLDRDVAIPAAGARMQFSHSFEFEPGFDGGVIEYSTNGGTSWTDAGSLIVAGAQYNTTLPTGFGNPLERRDAFSFPSFGYTATQLNVASLAGQNVRVRFRIGTDNGNTFFSRGWLIDDIRIYQCTGGGPVTLSVAPSR